LSGDGRNTTINDKPAGRNFEADFHLSFVILDLSFVIAGNARRPAMTNDKSKMNNGK
jgi:hypothetical protein